MIIGIYLKGLAEKPLCLAVILAAEKEGSQVVIKDFTLSQLKGFPEQLLCLGITAGFKVDCS